MFSASILLIALGAQSVLAAPYLAARWGNQPGAHGFSANGTAVNGTNTTVAINDTQILQFALTLEILESTFYQLGLSQFNDSAFQAAGFPPQVRERFVQIAEHEATHVQVLTDILGPDAPQPCNYTFPFNDPVSFSNVAFALENTGEGAYLGAAAAITNKTALTLAGTILTVEARQASWIGQDVLGLDPWNGPFDTPLDPSGVFSLASSFITSCPSTNPPLAVVPLPVITISPANATVNSSVSVTLTGQDFNPANISINATSVAPTTNGSTPLFLAFFNGFNVTFAELNADNTTTIPDTLAGVVFTSLVSTNETAPSPNTTLSGLTIINIPVGPNDTSIIA